MPSPAAKPTSWRIGMAASAASRSRLRWSWCRAPRPMVRPSVAAVGWTGALIWDANLGFGAGAAQEFRFVDERDAERLGLVALRAGIGAPGHRLGDGRADAADLADVGRVSFLEALHPPEVARQQPRSLRTDVADAEREEQRGQRSLFRVLDGREQLVHRLLCEPF